MVNPIKIVAVFIFALSSFVLQAKNELNPGETISKMICLEFNDYALKKERNEYVEFAVQYDTAHFEAFCKPEFKIVNNRLRVYAIEYQEKVKNQGKEGIVISFIPKNMAQEAYYDFKIIVLEMASSSNIQDQISYVNPDEFEIEYKQVHYFVPTPTWLLFLIYGGGSALIIFLLWFVFTRDDMPFGKKTFKKKGNLSIRDIEGYDHTFNLSSRKYKYGLRIEKQNTKYLLDGLSLLLTPVKPNRRVSKSDRVAQISIDGYITASISNKDKESLNPIFVPGMLYHNDEIILKTANNQSVHIKYLNGKIRRN